jgi:hypothetical protein
VTDGTTSDGSSANKTADGKTLKIDNEKDWNFDEAHKVWKLFITDGPDAAIAYMREHRDEGKDNTGIFSRLAEEFDTGVLKPIKDLGTEVAHVVGSVVTGLGAFLRLSLLQMNNGIGMKNNMQRRTNMLNRLLNDSLYYQAGSILATGPSLLRLADNPFTREYGEPVVEIREPFQRLHHVNSFQHILKNGIIETSDEIATVITAVSNGAHPVTVHFDKGSPAEYQKERVVDTDLLWDKVDGLPFIKNIPIIGTLSKSISAIFHPVTALRGAIKTEQGYSDELSSKRVALYHLRESLKDIYTGELLVIGDAGIRPHDLVYLSDVYERMYGFFEVEAVTHHFTPETGFVTGITPNAIVTVNDPGRWYIFSHLHQQNSFKALRDHMRQVIGVRTEGLANGATAGAGELNANDLVNIASNLYTDTTQYAGGMSSLVKDIAGGTASASIVGGGAAALGTSALASAGVASLAGGPVTLAAAGAGALFGGALAWDAWKWVRDNLLDQHGCYIQYLTKNGAPMDAGLAPNSSTAVGRQHGTSFTFNALRLPEFTIPTLDDVSKQKKITTSELLASLGYTPQKITEVGRFATKAAEDTAMRVMKLMQRGDALPGQYEWAWVKVVAVKDGDTVVVQLVADNAEDEADIKNGRLAPNMKALPGSPGPHGQEIRFLVVNSPEDHYSDKTNFKDTPDSLLSPTRGVIATQYTRARFFDDGAGASYTARTTSAWVKANGLSLKPYANEIGLRILKNEQQDRYKRTLAFLFHQGLKGQSARDRKRYIYQMATGDADWQNYTSDGNPLTYNQELLAAGMATIEVNPILRSLPGQGVELSGQ